jgi:hypothetical protein
LRAHRFRSETQRGAGVLGEGAVIDRLADDDIADGHADIAVDDELVGVLPAGDDVGKDLTGLGDDGGQSVGK